MAARLLVIDPDSHLLLFRFTPKDRPPLWATAGGEVDPGESFEDAARRELREETGITADPGDVVAERESDFVTFSGEPVHAVERYFAVRVASRDIDLNGHTPSEQAVMRHHEWWSIDDIRSAAETVYPPDLATILSDVVNAKLKSQV